MILFEIANIIWRCYIPIVLKINKQKLVCKARKVKFLTSFCETKDWPAVRKEAKT